MIPTIMIPVKEADILFNSTFKKKPKTSPYSMAPSSPLTPIRVSRLMSFKKFLKILSILAKKVYPSLKDPKQAFENLFNEKFFQNIVLQNERIANELKSSGFKSKLGQSEGNSRLSKTKNNESDFDKEMRHTRVATEKIDKLYLDNICFYLNNPKLIRFLECLHKTLFPFFQEYSIEGNLIDFRLFMQFFRDFQIFPDLISKVGSFIFLTPGQIGNFV